MKALRAGWILVVLLVPVVLFVPGPAAADLGVFSLRADNGIGATFFVDEVGGVCGGSPSQCPQTLDWTGSTWGTPITELAQVLGGSQDRMKAVWDISTGSTLHWFAVNTHDIPFRLYVFRCTNVDVCSIEDVDPGSANTYEQTDGVSEISRPWNLEIERASGELLLVWDTNLTTTTQDFCYRTRTAGASGTWSDPEVCVDHAGMGADEEIDWLSLANNPGSNRVAAGFGDTFNQDYHMATWDGSAWVNTDGACSTATNTFDAAGIVLTEDSADEFVAYCNNGNNSVRECEWTSAGGWESTVSCASFDSDPDIGDDDISFIESRPLLGTDTGMVCEVNDLFDNNCWVWDGVVGTGGTRTLFEVTDTSDVDHQETNIGFDWNPDQTTTRDALIVYPVFATSLSWGTWDDAANTFTVGSGTVSSTAAANFVWGYRAVQSSETWKVHIARGRGGGTVEMYRWDGSTTAPGSLQTLTTSMSNVNTFSMAFQTSPSPQPSPTDGLILFYDMETLTAGQMCDLSGNLNHGVITGASDAAGKVGRGRDFDGINDLIDTLGSYPVTGAFSASFWVKPDSLVQTVVIVWLDTGDDTDVLVVGHSSGGFVLASHEGVAATSKRTTGPLSTSDFTHVVVTKSATKVLKVYIDGVEDTQTSGGFWSPLTDVRRVGASHIPGEYWNGILDEIRFYNRELSAVEASDIFNDLSAYSGTCPSDDPPPVSQTFLVDFTYRVEGDTVYFLDLTRNVSGLGLTYRWQFGDGAESFVREAWHVYPPTIWGTYTVTLTVCDPFVCKSAARNVTVVQWDVVMLVVIVVAIASTYAWVRKMERRERRTRVSGRRE